MLKSPGLRLHFIFTALMLGSVTIAAAMLWMMGLGTRASREGEKEGRNENWKLKTSSDINKCKKGFKDLFSPECCSE